MKNFKVVILAVLISFLALSSCVTYKRCQSKFPPQIVKERYDSLVVRDSIVYKDRIVPFYIPGETIRKDSLIPGIPEKINTRPITLENKYAIAKAWIENSVLKMQLDQKDQVIKFKLDSADKVAKHWEYKYTNEKQTIILPPVRYIPGVYKVAFWLWIGVIISGIGYTAFRIFIKK